MKWGGWEEALTIETEATSMGQFSHMPVHCSPARTSRSSCLMWGWKYTAGAAACLWWAWVRVSWCLCTNRNCVTAGLCVLTSHLPHPQHWSRNLCCALYEVTVSTVTRWSFSPAVTSSACPCTRACTHYTDTQAHQRGLGQITCREVPIVHDSWPHLPTVAIIPGTFVKEQRLVCFAVGPENSASLLQILLCLYLVLSLAHSFWLNKVSSFPVSWSLITRAWRLFASRLCMEWKEEHIGGGLAILEMFPHFYHTRGKLSSVQRGPRFSF